MKRGPYPPPHASRGRLRPFGAAFFAALALIPGHPGGCSPTAGPRASGHSLRALGPCPRPPTPGHRRFSAVSPPSPAASGAPGPVWVAPPEPGRMDEEEAPVEAAVQPGPAPAPEVGGRWRRPACFERALAPSGRASRRRRRRGAESSGPGRARITPAVPGRGRRRRLRRRRRNSF